MQNNTSRWFQAVLLGLLLSIHTAWAVTATPATALSDASTAAASAPTNTLNPIQQKQLSALQLPFIANQGQLDPQVKFYARTFGGTTFVTADGKLVHHFSEALPKATKAHYSLTPETTTRVSAKPKAAQSWALIEELVHAQPIQQIAGEEPATSHVSSFIGNDPSKWQKELPTYGSVSLGEIYPNIQYRLRAYGNNVEKLFTVQPGGKPQDIQVRLKGAQTLKVTADGTLEAKTKLGPIRFTAPIAYQEKEGQRIPVTVAYAVTGNRYGFTLGDYDKTADVVIDPLLQSTYLGGGTSNGTFVDTRDVITSVALDAAGNVLVAGGTGANNFPSTAGGAQAYAGGTDVFVAKLNPNLTALIQATYLGGTDGDFANALVIDSAGNVIVAGWTASNNFPSTTGGAQANHGAFFGDVNGNAFVAKLNGNLTSLIQATYYGDRFTEATGLALESSGNIYVTGYTGTTVPGTSGGAQAVRHGTGDEIFIAKFNSTLTTIVQSSYLGGLNNDSPNAIAIDGSGNVYIAGRTDSFDFPGVSGGAQSIRSGEEGFVAKLNGALTSLIQSTYLGGNYGGPGAIYAIAINSSGFVYVTGYTQGTIFPGTAGGAQPILSGNSNAFVAKLTGNLTNVIQASYLGGSGYTSAHSLILDAAGDVYVGGVTNSTDFPQTAGGAQPAFGGMNDAFVAKLDGSLTHLFQATYLGGINEEAYPLLSSYAPRISLAKSSDGNIYVASSTQSSNFPLVLGGAQSTLSGAVDGFIVKISPSLAGPFVSLNPTAFAVFPIQKIGNSSMPFSINLTNSGSEVLNINAINMAGLGAASFTRQTGGGNCAVGLLAQGGSCTLTLIFTPNAVGPRIATLSVESNSVGSPHTLTLNGTGIGLTGISDFDADRKADILWRNINGNNAMWQMNAANIQNAAFLPGVSSDWTIAQVADFDGDGKSDIWWHNIDGRNAVWLMNGTTIQSAAFLPTIFTDWSIAKFADFNGDDKTDLLWHNNTTGANAIWLMNGTTIQSATFIDSMFTTFIIAEVADFNGDGKADIWWRNNATGANAVWLMNGTTIQSGVFLPTISIDWSIAKFADFDGDGKADLWWRNKTTGANAVWLMNGTTIQSGVFLPTIPNDWILVDP